MRGVQLRGLSQVVTLAIQLVIHGVMEARFVMLLQLVVAQPAHSQELGNVDILEATRMYLMNLEDVQ